MKCRTEYNCLNYVKFKGGPVSHIIKKYFNKKALLRALVSCTSQKGLFHLSVHAFALFEFFNNFLYRKTSGHPLVIG